MKKKTEMDKLEDYLARHGMRYDREIFPNGSAAPKIEIIRVYDSDGKFALSAIATCGEDGKSSEIDMIVTGEKNSEIELQLCQNAKDVIERLEARG